MYFVTCSKTFLNRSCVEMSKSSSWFSFSSWRIRMIVRTSLIASSRLTSSFGMAMIVTPRKSDFLGRRASTPQTFW